MLYLRHWPGRGGEFFRRLRRYGFCAGLRFCCFDGLYNWCRLGSLGGFGGLRRLAAQQALIVERDTAGGDEHEPPEPQIVTAVEIRRDQDDGTVDREGHEGAEHERGTLEPDAEVLAEIVDDKNGDGHDAGRSQDERHSANSFSSYDTFTLFATDTEKSCYLGGFHTYLLNL